MAMYHPGHPNGKYQMANLLRDAQRATMGEPEDSPAAPLLEGICYSDCMTKATGRRAAARAGKKVSAATTATVPTTTAEVPDVTVVATRMPPTYTNERLRAALRVCWSRPDVGILMSSQQLIESCRSEQAAERRSTYSIPCEPRQVRRLAESSMLRTCAARVSRSAAS